jgi:hypothetical protein
MVSVLSVLVTIATCLGNGRLDGMQGEREGARLVEIPGGD